MAIIEKLIEGVRYTGRRESNGVVMPGHMWCTECGNQVHQNVVSIVSTPSLSCEGCNKRHKVFKTEEDMNTYLSKTWTVLQQTRKARAG
jgi:hypothetical protein